MALSFPISPTPGQTYTYSGRTWVWTGSAWKVNDTGAINGIIIGNTTPAAGSFTTLTANGEVNLGNVGNITILGGTSGQVLSTDGAGNLSWADGGGGSNVTSIVVDNFTGNGVANSFVLTTTPISEDWVSVNYNGVMQQTDAYSVSGNTITFVTTPANTAAIEIRTVTFGGTVALANTAETVTGNAQANITSVGTLTSLTVSGNVTVSGTGSRIVGDFTSAANNRLAFQTSTANSLSIVAALPSGTGTTSILRAYCGSTPSTASFLDIRATSTATQLWSGREISSTFGFLPLTFHTNNAEQMRLDTSGNLGVGTNAPSQRLDVNGNVAITGSARRIIGDFSDATFSNRLLFQTSVANTNTIVGAVPSGTGQIAGFRVFNSSDSVNASFATLACNATVAYIDSSLSGTGSYLPLAFFTGGSERMRIDTGGNLIIGGSFSSDAGAVTLTGDGTVRAILANAAGGQSIIGAVGGVSNGFEVSVAATNATTYRWNNPAGTVMTLDAAGNLGLGTVPSAWSAPARAIHLGNFGAVYQNASGYPELAFNTFQNTSNVYTYRNTDVATRYSQTNGQHQWFTAPSGTAGSPITFTQAMTLSAAGDLLVGTTDTGLTTGNGFKLLTSATGRNLVINAPASTNANEGFMMYSTGAGAYRFYVQWNGQINATNTSITAISDVSLKENIRDLETGLDEIMALRPRRFDWKEETHLGEKNVAGFVAQELEQVLPDLVYEYKYNETGTKKSIKMGDILPTLVKAVQEQQAIIQQLQARLDAANL